MHQGENPSKLIRMIPMEDSFLKIWNEILMGLNFAQKSDENEQSLRLVLNKTVVFPIGRQTVVSLPEYQGLFENLIKRIS